MPQLKGEKLENERRLVSNVEIRAEGEGEDTRMIVEGYPIVFDQETYIDGWFGGFFEKVDPKAFDDADMSDVCFKYNHSDGFFILARTRNDSLKLTIDEKGVFMHAELIDTTQNQDVYKMIRSGLLKEGSFAFTIKDDKEELKDGEIHRTILKIGTLFDVSVCVNGAYGDLTDIYARSYEAMEIVKNRKVETLKNCNVLKLRNKNKIKLLGGKKS